MDKKGQIAGEVFIYIMAAIVIGGIVIIGYGAIKNIVAKSCDAEKITFKSDIENLVEKYTSYGSVNKKTLKAPCEYDTICFVDAELIGLENNNNLIDCPNNIIRDSVTSHVEQNIFVISNKLTIPIGYSSLIRLSDADKNKCVCIQQKSGNFYITFKGFGSYTEVSAG